MEKFTTEIGLFLIGSIAIILADHTMITSTGFILILAGVLRLSEKKNRKSGKVKMKESARKTEQDLEENRQYTVKHFSTLANRKRKRSYMVILKPEESKRIEPYILPELPPEKFTYENGEFKEVKKEGLLF